MPSVAITMYCMMYRTVELKRSAITTIWFRRAFPGNLHFESTKAAVDANRTWKMVATTVTYILLNMFLEKGTHELFAILNRSLKLSKVGSIA